MERTPLLYVGWGTNADELKPYPIDMAPLLKLPHGILDEQHVPLNTVHGVPGGVHQPTTIAQYGLAHWNAFLRTRDPRHGDAFLVQARWLLEHEQVLANGAGVWPIPFPQPGFGATGPWLSALTQGNVISVLVRAYQFTGDAPYLDAARRAAHAYTLDILDGGVSAPVGQDGIFFEEVATYPAGRILNGYVYALFGLYDFVRATSDDEIRVLAERSVATLHALINEYDMGFWSRYDLLHRRPASLFYHALHVSLLEALADYTGCTHCRALAARWAGYQRSRWYRLRYYVSSRRQRYRAALVNRKRSSPTHGATVKRAWRVAVPITAFPVGGGNRAMLAGVRQAMEGEWELEYLTRRVGPNPEGLNIHAFESPWRWLAREVSAPSNFPNVLLYVAAGKRALTRLLRQRHFDLVLPQDGAFTAAYSATAARKAGVPLVVVDQGNVTWPFSNVYRAQRLGDSAAEPVLRRLFSRLRVRLYLDVLKLLIQRSVRNAECFLIAGDEVENAYREHFAVPLSRIVHYPSMVRSELPTTVEAREALRQSARQQLGLAPDGVLVSLINRLTPEKGLDTALAAIEEARRLVGPQEAGSVRVLVAGSGPLRGWLEVEVQRRGLGDVCTLWGEAAADEVPVLLRATDIFLYTGTRGANFSMAVLEAMAGGCAIVATTEPCSNARLLAEGRGCAVDVGDVAAISAALVRLLSDPAGRASMGLLAQEYVATHHTAVALRRALRRATGWAPDIASLAEAQGAVLGQGRGGHGTGLLPVPVAHEEQ